MSVRTGMFLAWGAVLAIAGCAPHYILQLSNSDQATSCTLFEGGRDDDEEDDRATVLEDRERIAKVAAFFNSKKDDFYNSDSDSVIPHLPRCTVVFRRDAEETDRFWIDPTHLYLRTNDGQYFICKITERESRKLVDIFRSAKSISSFE